MKFDVRYLIAGYATGTLTDAEKRELFEAALHDPELFAEIAGDEPLRELLVSPIARAELLERVAPAPVAFRERFAAWLRRPGVLAGAGAFAVVVVVASVAVVRQTYLRPVPPPEAPESRVAAVIAPSGRATPAPAAANQGAAPTGQLRESSAIVGNANEVRKAQRMASAALDAVTTRPPQAAGQEPAKTSKVFLVRENETAPPGAKAAAPPPPPPAVAVANMPLPPGPGAAPPMRYEVERRRPSGEFVAEADISALGEGDVVRLRFRPVEAGFLTVHDASASDGAPLISALVNAGVDAITEPVTMDRDRQLQVVFTRVDARAPSFQALREDAGNRGAMRAAPAARFAARPEPDTSGQTAFTIELRRKR